MTQGTTCLYSKTTILLAYCPIEKVETQKSMTPISRGRVDLESQNNCGHTRRPAIHVFVVRARSGENHVGEEHCDRWKEVMTRHSNLAKKILERS